MCVAVCQFISVRLCLGKSTPTAAILCYVFKGGVAVFERDSRPPDHNKVPDSHILR